MRHGVRSVRSARKCRKASQVKENNNTRIDRVPLLLLVSDRRDHSQVLHGTVTRRVWRDESRDESYMGEMGGKAARPPSQYKYYNIKLKTIDKKKI